LGTSRSPYCQLRSWAIASSARNRGAIKAPVLPSSKRATQNALFTGFYGRRLQAQLLRCRAEQPRMETRGLALVALIGRCTCGKIAYSSSHPASYSAQSGTSRMLVGTVVSNVNSGLPRFSCTNGIPKGTGAGNTACDVPSALPPDHGACYVAGSTKNRHGRLPTCSDLFPVRQNQRQGRVNCLIISCTLRIWSTLRLRPAHVTSGAKERPRAARTIWSRNHRNNVDG